MKDGRLKALLISARRRMAVLSEVPTAAEAGVADAEYQFWIGLLAPRKTPRGAITRLNGEIQKTQATAELRERFRLLGAEPRTMTPEALDAFLAADVEATGRIVRAANIKPQ